jgi:hypothetical protein
VTLKCRCYYEVTSFDNDKKSCARNETLSSRTPNSFGVFGIRDFRGWNQSGYEICLGDGSSVLRIEPGDSGGSQDKRCVRFACRVDASLTLSEGLPSSINVIRIAGGLHSSILFLLQKVLRSAIRVSHDRYHNAGVTMPPSGKRQNVALKRNRQACLPPCVKESIARYQKPWGCS